MIIIPLRAFKVGTCRWTRGLNISVYWARLLLSPANWILSSFWQDKFKWTHFHWPKGKEISLCISYGIMFQFLITESLEKLLSTKKKPLFIVFLLVGFFCTTFPAAVILDTIKVASIDRCQFPACGGTACLPLVSSFCFLFPFVTAVAWNEPWRECIVWNTQKDLNVTALLATMRLIYFEAAAAAAAYVTCLTHQQWNVVPSPGPAVFCAYLHLFYKTPATIKDCLRWTKNTTGGMDFYIIRPAAERRSCI